MKTIFTSLKKNQKFSPVLFCQAIAMVLLLMVGLVKEGYGQDKVFVKSIESQNNVDNPNNVLVGQGSATENTFATVNSSTLIVNFAGHLEQDFEETLPANTTSYVRIGIDDAGLLNALLGGSLGTLLDDVLGILLGNHSFEVDVKNSAGGSVLSGTSANSFDNADGRIRVVQNALGQFFIAITPDQPYSRIRITDRTTGIIGVSDIDVYGAYYVENDDPCAPAFGTSFDGTGLTVDLLGIGGAGVTNPEFAIDSDPDNYSEIAIGTAGIGASMFQTVYFNTVSAKEDYFKVKLAIENGGVLTADLIGNIEIRAYNGAELVFSKKLQGGLVNGLDLLGLLQSGNPVTLPFGPGVEFDRVAIGYNSLISLSALSNSPIRLYSVERYGLGCPDPDPIVITPTDPMLLQKDCATEVLSFEHANFPYNAVDGNNDTYTTLEASSGILLGGVLGEAYSGHVELGFGSPVSAGDTVYVRIDFDEETLGSLLDGSVGELLGTTVDNVLFGNHYFTVEAKDGTGTVLERSSNNGFDEALGQGAGKVRIVQDKNGHYYVAITSDAAFSSIRITENLSSVVGLGTVEHMNVYHACFSTGSALCEQAFATYSESDGISLDLLEVGDAGVKNAHLAIDDDDPSVENDNTYSELGIGTAGIGANTFQFVDFHRLSSPADYFKVKIGFENSSLLDVELLNNIEIRAYDGETLVYSQRVQNGLVADLDILGLLSTDGVVTIPIGPGKAFDRVAVGISTLVDVNALSQPVRIYSIKRFGVGCPDPNPLPNNPETESPFTGPDCGIALGEFENTNFAYNAIDGDIDTYATLSAGSGLLLGGGAYSGYIELGYDAPVPALETSYIRIDMPDDGLLDALVGGSLGTLLADVGDVLVFGNHYFDISVRDATGTEIYSESSSAGFDNNSVRIVRDKFGRYYIAFTADEPYQSVRITLNNTAVAGLDAVTTMNVYSMCRETVFDPCEQATFTSFDGTGISLSLLEGASPAGVINPQYVIDENNSNYAEFTLGGIGVGVAASLYQDIYFKTKVTTTATDKVRLRMQVPDALANVDLLGAYRVYLYNGDQQVHDVTLRNALINEVDLLGLLNSGGRINVEFEPGAGVTYDRVRFEIASVVGVGVASPVRLYSVYRISDACPDPEFETPPFDVCADVIVDPGENVDDIQNLTDGNNNSFATIRSDAGLVAGIGAYSGYVELGFAGIVPAGTSSYIRIGYEEDILNSLLAGSIGDLVNGVLNGVALGEHYFDVTIKDASGNPIADGSGSSQNLFADANGQIRLVQDTKGRYYLEIRPTVDYQSVRLEDHTTALLGALSSEGHLDVYGMCHTPTTFECPAAFTTSYEGSGLNLDALNVGGAGVQNAFWAIDQNTSSASTLSLGTLNVGGSIQQNIQFDRVLPAGDPIQIKMKVGSGTLSAGILEDLEVIGYLDGSEVFRNDFNAAFVETNIVDVLNSAEPSIVTVNPTGDIDELVIRLSSVVSVSVAPNVSIYHIIPLCESFSESFLTVTKNNALADGTDYNEVTATILNQDGDKIDNQEVEFTIVNVDGTTSTETATTNSDGEAVLEIRSTIAGDATITATVGAMIIAEGSPAIVTFIIPNNLSISKVSDETDNRVTAGESTAFTLTITNDGPAPIAVGKVIPLNERPGTGLAITNYAITSGNATVSGTGNSALVTVDTEVPVDGTITITVTADVAANAPNEVFNGVDVWGPDRDPDVDTPDDTDDIGPIPVDRNYSLAGNITKIAADGTDAVAIAGEAFEYTVTVVNGGPSTILSGTVLYLQDELSAGQTINSIEAGSANMTVGTVAADGSFTVTANEDIEETEQFTLTVIADVAGDIVEDVVNNTINIWSDDPAGDYSTPEGTFTTPDYPVDRDYGFDEPGAVVKVATDGTDAVATAGESFSYTSTLINMGPSTIKAGTVLYLQDLASAGQTVTGITTDNGTVGAIGSDGEFTLTVADAVAPNETIVLTVSVDVAADIAADIVNNTINVWSDDPAGDYSTPEGTDTTPDYPVGRDYGFDDDHIAKVAVEGASAVAVAGEEFAYTVTVTNAGPSTILNGTTLYLLDELSAGQAISSITSTGVTVNGAPDADGFFTVTANADIAAGGTFTLTVTADVAADIAADEVSNTIHIWADDPAGVYDNPDGTATTPPYPVDRDYGFDNDHIAKVAVDGTSAVATAGEEFAYTVTVTNAGPSTILSGTTLYLLDDLSAGQSVSSITSTDVTVGTVGADGFFTVTANADIAAGGTFTLTVTADVAADITADEVLNTIHIWADDPAGVYDNPDGTATTPPYPVDRDYGFDDDHIAKVAVDGTSAVAIAGEEFAYTVTVTNAGPSTILSGTTLYLLDELSAGQSVSSITSTGVTVNGTPDADGFFTVTANGDIAAGGTFTLTVTADVAADIAADEVLNTIHIWADDPAGVYDNPDGTATTPPYPVDRDYNFDNITKEAANGPGSVAVAGEEFVYTVTVVNGGPSTILNGTTLYLQDVLSAGQSITSITATGVTVNGTPDADGFFTVKANADIAVGATFTLTVTADVAADIAADIVNNTINIWSDDPNGDPSNPEGTDTTPDYDVDRESNLSITKVADDARVIAGGSTSFTVTVTNNGPSAILSGEIISLGERPSTGLTVTGYTVTSGNGTAAGTGNSAELTTSAVIPVGGTITLTVTADVDENAPATVANGIDVWGPDKDPGTDPKDDGSDTPDIPVDRESNLSITKVADDARVTAGESTSFTVTVTNDGPSAIASGEIISLGERPSTGLTITKYEVTSGNGTAAGTGNSAEVTTSAVIPVGGTITLTVTADVDADAPATIANGIDVWGPDKDPETDPKDDGSDTPDIPVDRESNLSITKVADDARVTAGESTSFTVTVTNNGPSAIASGEIISLGERPSTGLTVTGYTVTSGNGTAAGTGNSAEVTTSAVIPVGGTITLTVTADVDEDAPATVANGIDVWGPDKDPGTDPKDDGSDTPDIPVDRESNLSITKVADDARVTAGESTSFTVTVTNDGPSAIASGEIISLGERPSTGLTITNYEVTSGNGTAAGTGNSAEVTTSAVIPAGGTITLTVTADVAVNAPATVANGIDVWGPDKDPGTDPKDDGSDTPDIPVDRESNLSITKKADQARVKAGESTSFTLTITNNGPSEIASGKVINLTERPGTGVAITGYEVTSGNGTAAGTGNKATVTTNAAIAVGGTIVVKVNADVAANAPSTITNGITVWGPDKDPGTDPEDDKDDTPPIPVDRESALSITKKADQARVKAGENTTFTLTITNNGPSEIASGKVINLVERPGTGVSISGYSVTSGNGTIAGTGNMAKVTTNKVIAVGGTIVVKVTAKVDADAPATITNGISVWGPDKPSTDDPDDKDDTPPIPVDRESVLSITKVADEDRVKAGESTTFTVTITNNGPAAIATAKVINLTERPGEGVTITGYEVTSGNGTAAGTGNAATVTTNGVIAVGGTITVKITADIAVNAPPTITNGISVWGPDKPTTEDPDDEDDTPEIPVDYQAPNAVDDRAETKSGIPVVIDVLANDEEVKWKIDPTTVEIVDQPKNGGTVSVSIDGSVSYTSKRGFEGSDSFTYRVKDENGNWSNTAAVAMTVLPNPLVFPNVFTPNGDGLNDVFEIKGLDQYPENELMILNRWGNQVFFKENYTNDWTGDNLTEGTYYYILRVKNASNEWDTYKGPIALIRVTK